MNCTIIKPDQTLDVKGMSCPMPLLKARKAISSIGSGQILEVLGTDPGAKNGLSFWCACCGHLLLGCKENEGVFTFYIKKG